MEFFITARIKYIYVFILLNSLNYLKDNKNIIENFYAEYNKKPALFL